MNYKWRPGNDDHRNDDQNDDHNWCVGKFPSRTVTWGRLGAKSPQCVCLVFGIVFQDALCKDKYPSRFILPDSRILTLNMWKTFVLPGNQHSADNLFPPKTSYVPERGKAYRGLRINQTVHKPKPIDLWKKVVAPEAHSSLWRKP